MTKLSITTFRRDERGSVAVWIAGGFTAIMGIGAIAMDLGHLYVEEQRLQATADIAVLAASKAFAAGEDAGAAAMGYVEKNMPSSFYGNVLSAPDVQQGVWNGTSFTPGGASPNAVRVTLRRSQANGNAVRTFLAGFLGYREMDIDVQATAATSGEPGCILALDPGATSDSLRFSSMGTVDLKPCVPAANSTDSNAIKVSSMDKLRAGSLYAAGGINAPGWAVDLDEPEQEYQAPVADPYASLPDPAPGGCTSTNPNVGSNISPGVYCGGLIASGSLTIQPGTYYIVDGDLIISSINSVTCNCAAPGSGVTFVLTGTTPGQVGTFEFSSINSISLRAPKDGSYDFPGMLLYVDRNAPYATSKFSQIDSVTFNGGVYAASQELNFNSIGYTAQTDCMHIVGFNVDFNSMDSFGRADNCGAYGTQQISIGGAGGGGGLVQ